MVQQGKWWCHVIINTLGSWLPGDRRGFRSRGHKIHCSGDYKNPPPKDEHEGLYRYSKMLRPNAVTLPAQARGPAGSTIVAELDKQAHQLLVLSVAAQHAHMLVELPRDQAGQWDIVGDCKRVSSHAVGPWLPGRVWGKKGKIIPIRGRAHHERVYHYIIEHADEGAWVWSFRNKVVFDPAR